MQVKVQYLGLIRSKTEKKSEKVNLKEGALLSDLLNKLVEVYGEAIKNLFADEGKNVLDPNFIVTVNGKSLPTDTKLKEGDTVSLMTVISGG